MTALPAAAWCVDGMNVNNNSAVLPTAVEQTSGMYNTSGQTPPPEMSVPMSRYADGYQRSRSQSNIEYVEDLRKKLYGEIPVPVEADKLEAGENKVIDDDALKSQIKALFVDELMRRQTVSGTFDLTQGTIHEFPTYTSTDPVVAFYKKSESEDLSGKAWNSEADSMYLRKAMKGAGTDEDAIIHVVVTRCNKQRQELKNKYKVLYGRDLIEDLESELSGNLFKLVWAMFVEPAVFDAWSIKEAIYELGTDESSLIEILLTRSNAELQEIKRVYPDVSSPNQKAGDRKLERDIKDDTSGDFKRLLISACQGQRNDISREQMEQAVEEIEMNGKKTGIFDINYSKLCDMHKAKLDAQRLFKAGEDCWGTDEETFVRIFGTKDFYHLHATWTEYVKITQRDILNSVERETSGNFRLGLKAIVMNVRCRPMFFAEKLRDCMVGAGTDNKKLIRIIVSRSEIDLVQIKRCFLELTKQTLWRFIKADCSGDYKKFLQGIIGKD